LLSIRATHDEAEPVVALQLFGQAAKRNKSTLQVRLPNDKIIFTKVTVICTFQMTSWQETITSAPNLPTRTSFTIPSYEETRSDIFIQYKGKSVPLQAWSGPEGSMKLKFPDFMTTAQDGSKALRTGRL